MADPGQPLQDTIRFEIEYDEAKLRALEERLNDLTRIPRTVNFRLALQESSFEALEKQVNSIVNQLTVAFRKGATIKATIGVAVDKESAQRVQKQLEEITGKISVPVRLDASALGQQAKAAKEKVDRLRQPVTIPAALDTGELDKQLSSLRRKLSQLEKGVTVPVRLEASQAPAEGTPSAVAFDASIPAKSRRAKRAAAKEVSAPIGGPSIDELIGALTKLAQSAGVLEGVTMPAKERPGRRGKTGAAPAAAPASTVSPTPPVSAVPGALPSPSATEAVWIAAPWGIARPGVNPLLPVPYRPLTPVPLSPAQRRQLPRGWETRLQPPSASPPIPGMPPTIAGLLPPPQPVRWRLPRGWEPQLRTPREWSWIIPMGPPEVEESAAGGGAGAGNVPPSGGEGGGGSAGGGAEGETPGEPGRRVGRPFSRVLGGLGWLRERLTLGGTVRPSWLPQQANLQEYLRARQREYQYAQRFINQVLRGEPVTPHQMLRARQALATLQATRPTVEGLLQQGPAATVSEETVARWLSPTPQRKAVSEQFHLLEGISKELGRHGIRMPNEARGIQWAERATREVGSILGDVTHRMARFIRPGEPFRPQVYQSFLKELDRAENELRRAIADLEGYGSVGPLYGYRFGSVPTPGTQQYEGLQENVKRVTELTELQRQLVLQGKSLPASKRTELADAEKALSAYYGSVKVQEFLASRLDQIVKARRAVGVMLGSGEAAELPFPERQAIAGTLVAQAGGLNEEDIDRLSKDFEDQERAMRDLTKALRDATVKGPGVSGGGSTLTAGVRALLGPLGGLLGLSALSWGVTQGLQQGATISQIGLGLGYAPRPFQTQMMSIPNRGLITPLEQAELLGGLGQVSGLRLSRSVMVATQNTQDLVTFARAFGLHLSQAAQLGGALQLYTGGLSMREIGAAGILAQQGGMTATGFADAFQRLFDYVRQFTAMSPAGAGNLSLALAQMQRLSSGTNLQYLSGQALPGFIMGLNQGVMGAWGQVPGGYIPELARSTLGRMPQDLLDIYRLKEQGIFAGGTSPQAMGRIFQELGSLWQRARSGNQSAIPVLDILLSQVGGVGGPVGQELFWGKNAFFNRPDWQKQVQQYLTTGVAPSELQDATKALQDAAKSSADSMQGSMEKVSQALQEYSNLIANSAEPAVVSFAVALDKLTNPKGPLDRLQQTLSSMTGGGGQGPGGLGGLGTLLLMGAGLQLGAKAAGGALRLGGKGLGALLGWIGRAAGGAATEGAAEGALTAGAGAGAAEGAGVGGSSLLGGGLMGLAALGLLGAAKGIQAPAPADQSFWQWLLTMGGANTIGPAYPNPWQGPAYEQTLRQKQPPRGHSILGTAYETPPSWSPMLSSWTGMPVHDQRTPSGTGSPSASWPSVGPSLVPPGATAGMGALQYSALAGQASVVLAGLFGGGRSGTGVQYAAYRTGTTSGSGGGIVASRAMPLQTLSFTGSRDFVQKMFPYAQQASKALGIPADYILAHWAIESGWGTSNFARYRNNFAGIGAFDSNPNNAYSYATPEDFTQAYITLLGSKRYQSLRAARTPWDFGRAITLSGYATDPNYASKIQSVVRDVDRMLPAQGFFPGTTQSPTQTPPAGAGQAQTGVMPASSPIGLQQAAVELARALMVAVQRNGVVIA